jgi:plastocyanin
MNRDTSSRPDLTGEFRVRFPLPVVLPLAAVAVIALAMWGFSRVLLAIPHEAATTVAIVTAANILIASAFVALRPRMHRVAIMEVALIALYPVVIAIVIANTGIGTEAAAEGGAETAASEQPAGGGANADATLVAESVSFDTDRIELPADSAATVFLDNQDTLPHNVALYETAEDADAQQQAIFQGETIDGGETVTYEFTTPAAGEYVFQCDVHPTMRGTAAVG